MSDIIIFLILLIFILVFAVDVYYLIDYIEGYKGFKNRALADVHEHNATEIYVITYERFVQLNGSKTWHVKYGSFYPNDDSFSKMNEYHLIIDGKHYFFKTYRDYREYIKDIKNGFKKFDGMIKIIDE